MGRRIETAEFLAECIADALIKLMHKTHIDKIKIQEITDLAKVGRMTYFRYFTSKEDVLVYKMTLLWRRWIAEHPYPHGDCLYDQAVWFFSFCDTNRDFLSILLRQNQLGVLMNAFQTATMPMKTEFGISHYQKLYAAYGMVGVVTGWFQNGCKETPEELASICTR